MDLTNVKDKLNISECVVELVSVFKVVPFRKPLNVTCKRCTPDDPVLRKWLMVMVPEAFLFFFSSGNYNLLLRKLLSGGCRAGSEVPWLKGNITHYIKGYITLKNKILSSVVWFSELWHLIPSCLHLPSLLCTSFQCEFISCGLSPETVSIQHPSV